MKILRPARVLAASLLVLAFAGPAAARDRLGEKRDEVRRMRDEVLTQLYEADRKSVV